MDWQEAQAAQAQKQQAQPAPLKVKSSIFASLYIMTRPNLLYTAAKKGSENSSISNRHKKRHKHKSSKHRRHRRSQRSGEGLEDGRDRNADEKIRYTFGRQPYVAWYRSTWLIRNRFPLGPFSRPMPRALWQS